MTRIRLLSPYPLVTGADGRPVDPPLVVEAPPHVAAQLVAACIAEETDADIDGEVSFEGFGEPSPFSEGDGAEQPADQPAGKRRRG